MNLIPFAEHVSRAYEIAKAGDHTIGFVVDDTDKTQPHPKREDAEMLRDFYGLPESVENPDMIIELAIPHPDAIFSALIPTRKFETLEDIEQRIADFRMQGLIVSDDLNSSCLNLLKSAIEKLKLGLCDCHKILAVAKTIAGLGKSEKIFVEHIAEAIQYRSIDLETYRKFKA